MEAETQHFPYEECGDYITKVFNMEQQQQKMQ